MNNSGLAGAAIESCARRRIAAADGATQPAVRSHGPVMAKCFSLWWGFTLMVGSRVAALIGLVRG